VLTKVDEVSTELTYIGTTKGNNSTGDPVWKITRINVSGKAVDMDSVIGVSDFNAIWDDRASYTYG